LALADTVTSQTLVDGERNIVMKFTNVSDGTGESEVKKVDVSELVGAPDTVRIDKVTFMTNGIGVRIDWHGETNVQAMRLPQDTSDTINLRRYGGVVNNVVAGKTGDILFTTTETALAGDGYTVILEMVKT